MLVRATLACDLSLVTRYSSLSVEHGPVLGVDLHDLAHGRDLSRGASDDLVQLLAVYARDAAELLQDPEAALADPPKTVAALHNETDSALAHLVCNGEQQKEIRPYPSGVTLMAPRRSRSYRSKPQAIKRNSG